MAKTTAFAASYITPNQHEKNEWARMAQSAYSTGHSFYGHRYSAYAALKTDAELPINVFDTLQRVYRTWLTCGWSAIDGDDQARWTGTY